MALIQCTIHGRQGGATISKSAFAKYLTAKELGAFESAIKKCTIAIMVDDEIYDRPIFCTDSDIDFYVRLKAEFQPGEIYLFEEEQAFEEALGTLTACCPKCLGKVMDGRG